MILVFQESYLIEGVLSRLNDKMAGFLRKLGKRKFWTGGYGETVLLASQDTIRADKILLKGLGERSLFDDQILIDSAKEVSRTLDRLKIKEFGLHIPVVVGSMERYAYHMELSIRHLVGPFFQNHHDESNFLLKIVFSIDRYLPNNLNPLVERLRAYFDPVLDLSIIIDRTDHN